MPDDARFEARLADALGRYADLAPAMDDARIAHRATTTGPARRTAWVASLLRVRGDGLDRGRPMIRVAWLLVVLALALVAVLLAVAGGAVRRDSRGPLGRNGAIAFTVQGNDHLAASTHVINSDGTGDRSVDAGRCPIYSADGSALATVAYEGSASLVVAGTDGTPVHKIPLVESPLTAVVWAMSPDGSRVAWFKSPPGATGPVPPGDPLELWVAPVAGGPAVKILEPSDDPSELRDSLWWSPDGRAIAFGTSILDQATGDRHRTAIDVVAADGTDLHRVTSRPGLPGDGLSWSPDGRSIAYVGVSDGQASPTSAGSALDMSPARDLFVIGVDGTDDRHLTDPTSSGAKPGWSPDGGSIAFVTTTEGGPPRLATIRMNGPIAAGPPVLGPESAWFVWSPDSTRLLWLELKTIGAETFRSTLHSIDRDFRESPVDLQVIDGQIVCPPTWQRLAP